MTQNLLGNYLLKSLIQFSGSDFDREINTAKVFSRLCRTCLSETPENNFESNFLLDADGNVTKVKVKQMLEIFTGIIIDMDDKMPHHMCNRCVQAVEAAFAFRNQSQRVEKILKGLLPTKQALAAAPECRTEVIRESKVMQASQQNNDCQLSFVIDELTEPTYAPCNLCNENLLNHTELEAHMAKSHPSNSKKKLFKCGICPREYVLRSGLHNHMVIAHAEKKEIKCNVCLKQFTTIDTLRTHMNKKQLCVPPSAISRLKRGPARVILHPVLEHESFNNLHIEIRNLTCSLCDKTFELEVEFLNHLQHHKTTECPLCLKNFTRAKFLEGHVWSHGFERPFICPICQKGFQTTPGLRGHIKGHNERDLGEKKTLQETEEVFLQSKEPNVCIYKMEPEVDLNETDHYDKKTMRPATLESEDNQLQIYAKPPIEVKEEIIIEDPQPSCKIINEPLSDEEPLQDPAEAIGLDNFTKFTCELKDCKLEFKYYTGIINHYIYQHCKWPELFKCPVCLEHYTNKLELRDHLKSHLKCEYKCPNCIRVYTQLFELNAHMRTHTGERPFKCSKCPKAFKQRSARRTHLKTHNASKEFKCTICNRDFFSYNGKFLHMKRHHDVDTDLQCEFCNRQFPIKSRLQRHQNGLCKVRNKKK